MTNLFNLDETEFKDLYFKKWRIEVKYDVVKNKLEIPYFGVFSANVIIQDFWISMYLANMAVIAKNKANEKIKEERSVKDNKYEYQENVNTLIGSMKDRLADAIFSRNLGQCLNKLRESLQKYKNLLCRFVLMMGRLLDMKIPENAHIIIIRDTICDVLKFGIVNFNLLFIFYL